MLNFGRLEHEYHLRKRNKYRLKQKQPEKIFGCFVFFLDTDLIIDAPCLRSGCIRFLYHAGFIAPKSLGKKNKISRKNLTLVI